MNIPFSPPDIGEAEIAEVTDTLRSGWITTGPKTKKFEKLIKEYTGAAGCACLNSQTACGEMTLRLLGVGEGDEVSVPAYTYAATASVVCPVGATLKMVDVKPGTLEMDREKLVAAVTEKTKVIIPVDVAGIMCDYDSIYEIVERKKALFTPENDIQKAFGRIIVMADGAHSLGAVRNGVKSGNRADFTNFSFHAVKNLTTAEGGAVTWRHIDGIDDEEIYKKYMLLSLHGQTKDALHKSGIGAWEYDIVEPYFKCNMTDIMASVGLVQLSRYEGLLARRQQIIAKYNAAFSDDRFITPAHRGENFCSSGHLYLLRIKGIDHQKRCEIINKMGEKGIACNVHYKPLPLLSAYKKRGFDIANYPESYKMYENEISLPLHTLLTDEQVGYIISSLKEIVK